MSKSLLSCLLFLLVPVLLLSGCGWNTDTAIGEQNEVVNKTPANNVVGGKVVHNTAGAVVESVTVNSTPPKSTKTIGTDGSFSITNVIGTGRVIAVLLVGNSRRQLYSDMSNTPAPTATIITTYRDNWNGETSITIGVEGNSAPIHVTPLTDIVYRPQNSATRETVNAFLNQYFATTDIDYVANPQPSPEVTTVACSRFPQI